MKFENLPGPLLEAQKSLEPYLRKRQEANHIRRLLALHINTYLVDDHSIPQSLSLVEPSTHIKNPHEGVCGTYKEYLRCLRSNITARNEYTALTNAHQSRREIPRSQVSSEVGDDHHAQFQSFLGLVKDRQKLERLRIINDYIDVLSETPAGLQAYLDSTTVLKNIDSLPQVPSEFLDAGPPSGSGAVNLGDLVDQLEKSVLRAKLLLKKEQRLLAKVRLVDHNTPSSHKNKLQAIGKTRNELITWIETELASEDDRPPESDGAEASITPGERNRNYIDNEVVFIQQRYYHYNTAREALLTSVTQNLDVPNSVECEQPERHFQKDLIKSSGVHTSYAYLQKLISISNEQKAMLQQKSYLAISLGKQLKEASQGMDRLADESHLLPTHPAPKSNAGRKGHGPPNSFTKEVSTSDRPDSSLRAKAWAYAAKSAGTITRDFIADKLDDGSTVILEAQETLLELLGLFGNDTDGDADISGAKEGQVETSGDVWSTLEGNLGVI